MEQHRHICKLCNKTFLSGRVLGGHMRSHRAKSSAKTEKKLTMSNVDFEVDADERVGYGLRVNPKKTRKFSGPKVEASEEESFCKVCGKGFDSARAMFGHMRHHSGRERKETQCCKVCGKGFDSMRALTAHCRSHSRRLRACDESESIRSEKLFVECQYSSETMGLIRRKRSKRLRYKISPSSSFSSLNESKYVAEFGLEVVEGAICLMIISSGVSNWGRFSSVTESSDNNLFSLEVQSPGQKSFKNNQVKLVDCLSDCKSVFTENKILDFGETYSGFASDEEKIGKFQVSIERFYRSTKNCKRPKLDEESAFGLCDIEIEKETNPTQVEMDVDIREEVFDVAELGSMMCGLNKKATESEVFAESEKKREHKCRTCNKVFQSYQALGGHQRVHKGTKNCSVIKIEDCEDRIQINKFSNAKLEGSDSSEEEEEEMEKMTLTDSKSKGQMCSICFKVFATGQALGGHKRGHFGKDSEAGTELKQQISDICDAFDISQQVKLGEESGDGEVKSWWLGNEQVKLGEENGDGEAKSWWLGNEHKHELLVGLMPN